MAWIKSSLYHAPSAMYNYCGEVFPRIIIIVHSRGQNADKHKKYHTTMCEDTNHSLHTLHRTLQWDELLCRLWMITGSPMVTIRSAIPKWNYIRIIFEKEKWLGHPNGFTVNFHLLFFFFSFSSFIFLSHKSIPAQQPAFLYHVTATKPDSMKAMMYFASQLNTAIHSASQEKCYPPSSAYISSKMPMIG